MATEIPRNNEKFFSSSLEMTRLMVPTFSRSLTLIAVKLQLTWYNCYIGENL